MEDENVAAEGMDPGRVHHCILGKEGDGRGMITVSDTFVGFLSIL